MKPAQLRTYRSRNALFIGRSIRGLNAVMWVVGIELRLVANRHGARVVEILIHVRPRRSEKSHWDGPGSWGLMHFKQALVLIPRLIFLSFIIVFA